MSDLRRKVADAIRDAAGCSESLDDCCYCSKGNLGENASDTCWKQADAAIAVMIETYRGASSICDNRVRDCTPADGNLQGWQPIETAPKDDEILVYRTGQRFVVRWFSESEHGPAWVTPDLTMITSPTHWHPLPAFS